MELRKVVFALALLLIASSSLPAQTGSISGRVTQHGKGLPNILVKASQNLVVQPEGSGIDTRTDSQGYYRFSSIVAGQYFITVFDPGLVPLRNDAVSGSPRQVSVPSGETISNVDFALIQGGTITGTVTDNNGKPIARQPIKLTFVTPQSNPTLFVGNPTLMRFTSGYFRTDESGFYRVVGVPPGTYLVSVGSQLTAFASFNGRPAYRQTFYPSTIERANARPIEIKEAATLANIDLKLSPPVATFSASGRVLDKLTGTPVPAVAFDLQIEESGERGVIPKAGTSDQSGEFKLENLPAARYRIKVAEERGQAKGEFFGSSSAFDIRDANVSGVELRVEKSLSVSGTVVIANTNEPAIMAKATQIQLLVIVSPNDHGPLTTNLVKPSSNLTFSASGLKPGQLRVHPNSEKQITELGLRFLRMELGGSPTRDVEIGHDKPLKDLRVILVYGSGSLRGSVKLINGTLPTNARVAVNVQNEDGFYAGGWVDPSGIFLLSALPAGNFTLTVSAEEPGKRTLGPKTRQSISISENKVATADILLDLSALKAP